MNASRIDAVAARVILLLYFLLAFGFSGGPVQEGSDEIKHFRFVTYLATEHHLPDPATEPRGQYHQAPLYYALMTPYVWISGLNHIPDWEAFLNPFYGHLPFVPNNDNKNVYLHPTADHLPDFSDPAVRAMRLIRWAGVTMGGLLVIITYEAASLFWPSRPGLRLIAMGFAAFMPNFLFNTGIVSNDVLTNLLCGLALLLLLRQEIEGPGWELAAWLGLVLGAALLSKANAGVLVFPVGAATLLRLGRTWRYAALTLGLTLLLAGWWYLRNQLLYNDFVGARSILGPWGAYVADGAFVWSAARDLFPFAYASFWARFGHGGIPASGWVYTFFDFFIVGLGLGLAISIWRMASTDRDRPGWGSVFVLSVYALSWLGMVFYFSGVTWFGNQGRYLLLGMAGWGLLVGFALLWLPSRIEIPAALGLAALLFGVANYTLFADYLPSLRPSPYVEPIYALGYRYDELAQLRGVSEDMLHVRPGEITTLTLSWEALGPAAPEQDIQTYLHTLDSELVRRDSYPGTGNLLATDWHTGQRWSETYWFQIPEDAEIQRVYPLVVGFTDMASSSGIPAFGADGSELTPVIGRIAVNGPVAQDSRPVANYGSSIGLEQPWLQIEAASVTICLPWIALKETPIDYQVFVHVIESVSGAMLDQRDFQPLDWRYPTSAWASGERVIDCTRFDASDWPESGWEMRAGIYDLNSGQRLPLTLLIDAENPATDYYRVVPPT